MQKPIKGPFTLNVNVNVCICFCVKFWHCVYGDIDINAENGHTTHSLRLHFVTIASIVFENANADVDAKCEWALTVSIRL